MQLPRLPFIKSARVSDIFIVLSIIVTAAACTNSGSKAATSANAGPPANQAAITQASDVAAGASLPELKINQQRAMQYVSEIVAIGPRPVGSVGHKKVEAYIHDHLKGAQVEDDVFTDKTPAGPFEMRNIIAKFPGNRDGVIVLASHYDTVYPLGKTFVGANDGGSSTGLLLEFATQLREQSKGKPLDGYSIWLVFFDGEEAFQHWSDSDSLYGSRHLAEKWEKDGTLKQIKSLLLADMIGDANLNIEWEGNSDARLKQLMLKAATGLGYQSHFFSRQLPIDDDHIPFVKRGVPCADFIDLDYGYDNVFWHTPQDTLDKLSAKSLQITGDVMLGTVRLIESDGLPAKSAGNSVNN
jgi:glutaminyl-peptide cyclotransferase